MEGCNDFLRHAPDRRFTRVKLAHSAGPAVLGGAAPNLRSRAVVSPFAKPAKDGAPNVFLMPARSKAESPAPILVLRVPLVT